ncbi:hypothetical protein Tco_0183518 [Tanacetum coccineum]
MPPRMMTRSAGRSTAAPRGGMTGGRTVNEANGGVDEFLNFSMVIAQQLQNLLPTIIAQVGNHVNNQGNNGNQNDNVVNDNTQGDVRNINVNNSRGECSYKEFLACNPKDFDGMGGVIACTL